MAATARESGSTSENESRDSRLFSYGKRYSIIYADPPWLFRTRGPNTNRRPPYACMPTEEIASLPVRNIAAEDCVLFLWATYPCLPEAFKVIAAWGFAYKTVAFTWVKTNPSGQGFHFGLGYWTRANPEICLLATRGRPIRQSRSVPNLVVSRRREHSRKPDAVRQRIVDLCGNLPRLELFARELVTGWDAWGDAVARGMGDGT